MEHRTTGIILSTKLLWFLKINSKPMRVHTMDGANFPYIIKVKYEINGITYIKQKFVSVLQMCPCKGDSVNVFYKDNKERKAKIEINFSLD